MGTAGAIDHPWTVPGAKGGGGESHLSSQGIEEERDVTSLSKCNLLQNAQENKIKCRLLTWFSQLVSWMSTVRSLLAAHDNNVMVVVQRRGSCRVVFRSQGLHVCLANR